jgi:transcriptional regulator with XRE-family HTH domain
MNTVNNFYSMIEASFEDSGEQALDSLSGRIKYALERKGVSKAKLAKMIGVKHQVIQYLCSHDIKNSRFLPSIAEALNIDMGWLTTGQGAFQPTDSQQPPLYEIPLLDEMGIRYLCANHDNTSLNQQDIAPYVKSIITSTQKPTDENSTFCFILHDSAMSPAIPTKSLVFVDQKKPLSNESYGLFLMQNKEIILRKIQCMVDEITLLAFNKLIYKNILLSEKDFFIGAITEIRWFS